VCSGRRKPAELGEIDEALVADLDAFALEELALERGADRIVDRDAAARLARLADHALPRQARLDLHRRAADASAVRDARHLGHLAVGRDAATWDPADDGVDRAK
jgi:hypothetical protein